MLPFIRTPDKRHSTSPPWSVLWEWTCFRLEETSCMGRMVPALSMWEKILSSLRLCSVGSRKKVFVQERKVSCWRRDLPWRTKSWLMKDDKKRLGPEICATHHRAGWAGR